MMHKPEMECDQQHQQAANADTKDLKKFPYKSFCGQGAERL
jgi:hypothetical protein